MLVVIVPLSGSGEKPKGSVQVLVDGEPHGPTVPLGGDGTADVSIDGVPPGPHRVEVQYTPEDDAVDFTPPPSPAIDVTVPEKAPDDGGDTEPARANNWIYWLLVLILLIIIAALALN